MSNDILDDFGREEKATYANKSVRYLVMAVAAYILILLLGILLLERYQMNIIGPTLLFSIALFAFVSTLLGFVNGIRSILNKEPNQFKKIGATLGNFILLLIMSLVIFANALDIMAAMG